MQDLTVNIPAGCLNIRGAAWIENDNDEILVSKFPDERVSLIGGRVKFTETTTEAIKKRNKIRNRREFIVSRIICNS